jgi:hypothetical protein
MRWTGNVACLEEKENAYSVLMGKAERRRPLGRPRIRWEDNMKMGLTEIGSGNTDWIDLAVDWDQWRALVNIVMNLQVPLNVAKFFSLSIW